MSAQEQYYEEQIKSPLSRRSAGIYSDVCSGTTIKGRKRLNTLTSAYRCGKVDIVLIKYVSSFDRNTVDALKTIHMLRRGNMDVNFEAEDIHSLHEASEFLLTVIYAQA